MAAGGGPPGTPPWGLEPALTIRAHKIPKSICKNAVSKVYTGCRLIAVYVQRYDGIAQRLVL